MDFDWQIKIHLPTPTKVSPEYLHIEYEINVWVLNIRLLSYQNSGAMSILILALRLLRISELSDRKSPIPPIQRHPHCSCGANYQEPVSCPVDTHQRPYALCW